MKKVCDWMSKILTEICLVLVVIYAVLVAVQVISRYVFNSPTTWTELVARYLFIWSCMLYMPVLYRKHGDSRFDMIFQKQKPEAQRSLTVGKDIIVCFCALALLFWGIKYCKVSSGKFIKGLSIEAKIPMNTAYSSIPVGGFFLFFVACEQLINDCRKTQKQEVRI